MVPRDTRTGAVLEQMVLPALRQGGYAVRRQVNIGSRPSGRRHVVDVLATGADGKGVLISLKWQEVSGTAEQKVPFEVICLAEAIRARDSQYQKAYLVLGGPGWSLREFYTGGGLNAHLRYGDLVSILPLETFIATANQGTL